MAILKGIDVTVRVNEQPLHEYNDDEDDNGEDNAITRYVEATSGAQFSIDYEASASFKLVTDVVAVEFRLDGGLVDTAIHRKEKLSNYRSLDGSWSSAFYGTREPVGKGWRMRPFIFEEIAIVDEAIASRLKNPSTTNMGTVVVAFYHRRLGPKSAPAKFKGKKEISQLTEKNLKGKTLTHNAKLGMAKDIGNVTTWKTYPADGHEDPFATFNFKYRSRRALKSLLLIPRTPSPIPLEDRDFETLTQEERDEFARGQHTLKARLRAERELNIVTDKTERLAEVKRERDDRRDDDEEYSELLRSAKVQKVQKRPFEPGEVVVID
ncbi:hypothetical protein MMC21_007782 [Puttea exsequens]|nr:hypothetical protein [Puttea exsequens]